MVALAVKNVLGELLNTWGRGPSLRPLITNLGPVVKGGDSVDIPYSASAFTVNRTETAGPAATGFSARTLVVDRPLFINQELTKAQTAQLLGGKNAFTRQTARKAGADMNNELERDLLDFWLAELAGSSPLNHANLDGGALADSDVNNCVAALREQDGVANTNEGLFWLVHPRAEASVKGVAAFSEAQQNAPGEVGLQMIGRLAGVPSYLHNGVPGRTNGYRLAVLSGARVSGVITLTLASTAGFVLGQQIYTTGLAANPTQSAPATITAIDATTITFSLAGADNATLGTGFIYSATAMALLCYGPWLFYGLDGEEMPEVSIVERTDAAGSVLKLFHNLGREGHFGAVKVLHTPAL